MLEGSWYMASQKTATPSSAEKNIQALAQGEYPVLETLAQMTVDTRRRSGLNDQAYWVARIAALVSMDASPISYLANLGTAKDMGIPLETVQGTLVAIAPVVGTARVVSAASKMLLALGIDDESTNGGTNGGTRKR